jgi:hypothetical protein
MANGWKLTAILMVTALAPASARAQFLSFGKKAAEDPPPAFSTGQAPQEPQFAPDPKSVPKGAPDFCPNPGDPHTPFVPVEEENRNAFRDYKVDGPSPLQLWLRADYLNWQFRKPNLAAILVTTDTAPNSFTDFGALGQPNTQILLNSGPFNQGHIPGGRLTAGFSPGFFFPVEISAFSLQKNLTLFSGSSQGGPNDQVLARPVLSSQNNQESVFLGGFPGLAAGNIIVDTHTNLWGIDANAYFNFIDYDVLAIDLLLGYRYTELRENISIVNSLTALNGFVIPFDAIISGVPAVARFDQFATRNQFNGGQLGFRNTLHYGRVALILDSKLALGQNHETLNIEGTSGAPNGATPFRGLATVPGGVLAVPSNIGVRTSNDFSLIPQFDLNVAFQLHRSVRLFAGISWMYWNNLVRPGDQLNNVIDTRQVPSSNFFNGQSVTQPPHPFNRVDFDAYGFNVGVLIGF